MTEQAFLAAFSPDTLVMVSLANPREKFWGALLQLSPAGVSLRGIDLGSFDDFARQTRAGEAVAPSEVFFPLHRVERIEADLRSGDIPSLAERFERAAGRSAAALFAARSVPA
jgi:2,4-dienoyl-CoA reductase-like NADH-dependent reductase (Old Yellow Enzyme family)